MQKIGSLWRDVLSNTQASLMYRNLTVALILCGFTAEAIAAL